MFNGTVYAVNPTMTGNTTLCDITSEPAPNGTSKHVVKVIAPKRGGHSTKHCTVTAATGDHMQLESSDDFNGTWPILQPCLHITCNTEKQWKALEEIDLHACVTADNQHNKHILGA